GAALESKYCCAVFNSLRAAFFFSRMTFSSARDTYDASMVPLLRPPQVFVPDDGLLDPAPEANVDHEGGAASLHDRAGHAVEPVVRPPSLDARIDDDRHMLADLEGLERPGNRGEPALAGTAAALQ